MQKVIDQYKIKHLWHFTDSSNWRSIQEHGLLSLSNLRARRIQIPMPGGNDWSQNADTLKGLDHYVHLCFVKDHPMQYRAAQEGRIENTVWLKISPAILLSRSARFSAGVSNRSDVRLLTPAEAKNGIDFPVLFTFMDWSDPEVLARRQRAVKSEILIPDSIPTSMILGTENG